MYEQHFGLKKRPFRAKATGTDVFVGPQTATTMAGIKKALVASDAVASVSGPIGSGKTTLVMKALDSMAGQQKVIRVGRMRLDSNDVLGLLLDELGVENLPGGTIQKFNAFRRRLKELEDCTTRLVIAIEDSKRLGVDTLAEIEALTAADAGASEGASIVLMGDEDLDEALRDPQLGRLRQRIRQRLQTTPLCSAELRGYLRHCFRLAGGDFEQVFESNAAALLHHLTGGIPRVANALLEAAMTTAADQGLDRVSTELLARIGENEFGLSAEGFDLAPPPVVETPAAPKVAPPAEEPPAAPEEPAPAVEAALQPIAERPEATLQADEAEEPVIVFADVPEPADLPELIQDTLPDLQVLAPEFAGQTEPRASVPESIPPQQEAPEVAVEPPPPEPEVPVLQLEEHNDDSNPADDEIPAWDRDPTMAELRPDLAALEQAMAFAHSEEPERPQKEPREQTDTTAAASDAIPEITLDHAISQRIESQLIDEPGQISPQMDSESPQDETKPEIPALKVPEKKADKNDTEIEKIAAGLSRAKSLEDVDDRMAETLFGDEFSLVASQFMKKPAAIEPANDDIDKVVKIEAVAEAGTGEQQVATANSAAANNAAANSADYEVTLDSDGQAEKRGMDLSASQRLKTVRALNADLHPALREPETAAANGAPPIAGEAPESIEDQINTSMTQTLKALNVRPPVTSHDDDDDEDKNKSGFFSRFKRS